MRCWPTAPLSPFLHWQRAAEAASLVFLSAVKMAVPRKTLLSLFFLALACVVDAATMSPSFEKSLDERLSKYRSTLESYPKLKYSTYLPDSVEDWQILSLGVLSSGMKTFSDSLDILVPDVLKENPGDAAIINQFTKDCRDFIAFFDAGVKSGDISNKATTPPATSPPATPTPTTTRPVTTRPTTAPPPTTTPRAIRGSGSDDGDIDVPYSYTPYSYNPSPALPSWDYYDNTPSPHYVHYEYHTTKSFSAWKIGLIVASVVIFIIKMIHYGVQRDAEQKKKKEEEDAAAAAALQVEGGEANQAAYVVIRPTENATHTTATPMKV